MNAQFETILDLEHVVQQGTDCLPLAMNRAQAKIGLKADRARLSAAIDALTLDELKAYGEYRKVHKAH